MQDHSEHKICTLTVTSDVFCDEEDVWITTSVVVTGDQDVPDNERRSIMAGAMSQTAETLQRMARDGVSRKVN